MQDLIYRIIIHLILFRQLEFYYLSIKTQETVWHLPENCVVAYDAHNNLDKEEEDHPDVYFQDVLTGETVLLRALAVKLILNNDLI